MSANFPNLVAFSRRCTTAGAGQPVGPPPPPAAGGSLFYTEGTLAMSNADVGATAKRQNRFKQNMRADLADALSLDQEQLLITAVSPSSITIEIFGSQAEVQADSLASVLYGVCAFASIVCAAAFSLLHRSYPTDRRSANTGKRLALGGRPGSIV